MVVTGDGELGFDSGEGAWEAATTSKEGSRRAITQSWHGEVVRINNNTGLDLRQTTTVEDYASQFQSLQYDVTMHGGHDDPVFFATQFVKGLREDIRVVVEPQVPTTVDRAVIIAKIQQKVVDRSKLKGPAKPMAPKPFAAKPEAKQATTYTNLWRDKQLRDYRKTNNLCYSCGEKYEPGHAEVCSKRGAQLSLQCTCIVFSSPL